MEAIEGEKLYSSVLSISTGSVVMPMGMMKEVMMTSPKEVMKDSKALVMMPERILGRLISQRVRQGFAPSTRDASSMDGSKFATDAETVRMT